MTTKLELAQNIMDDAIGRAVQVMDKQAIVTRWYVVAEAIDQNGQMFHRTLGDDESVIWGHKGLLQHALDHIEDED